MNYTNEWDLKGHLNTAGLNIVGYVHKVIKEQMPEYSEFFPFKTGYKSDCFNEGEFFCLRIEEIISQMPQVGKIDNIEFIELARKVYTKSQYPSFDETFDELKSLGFRFDLFTYVGKVDLDKLSWIHIEENIISWLNMLVVPRVIEMNIKRVTDAIPTPPSFDTEFLLRNIYVLESESGMKQGTAFHVKGIGIVTCDHCLRSDDTGKLLQDVKIFKGNKHNEKFSIEIIKTIESIDIALINCLPELLSEGLELGSSDNLKQLDHIATAGFPNYNYGDNGIFCPGLITGFRIFSGLRHILVNSPLISGNSGGPAFDKNSRVIGIAVTGADKMSQAHETEKHGLIPIEAILNLK